jgi:hypothetical protein
LKTERDRMMLQNVRTLAMSETSWIVSIVIETRFSGTDAERGLKRGVLERHDPREWYGGERRGGEHDPMRVLRMPKIYAPKWAWRLPVQPTRSSLDSSRRASSNAANRMYGVPALAETRSERGVKRQELRETWR